MWLYVPFPSVPASEDSMSYLCRLRSLSESFCGGPASSFRERGHD